MNNSKTNASGSTKL